MNPIAAESEFRAGIKKLLDDIDNQFKHGYANTDAYGRDEVFHERDARIFFFDRLLQLLGWNLGMGGNVAQEARIKAGTTKFVDYVGINQDTRSDSYSGGKSLGQTYHRGQGREARLVKSQPDH